MLWAASSSNPGLFVILLLTTTTSAALALSAVVARQVQSKQEALNVQVFRNFSCSVGDLLSDQPALSWQEAFDFLTSDLDDQGRNRKHLGDPITCFYAARDDGSETHQVLGVVDAQVKVSDGCINLKNLRVDERARRQGIGSMLVSRVKEYALAMDMVSTVVLHVDLHNQCGAVSMYENNGFVFSEKNAGDGRMILDLSSCV